MFRIWRRLLRILSCRLLEAAGYVASSPTARRLREASFLPVQSPTEGHLRFELSKYDHLEDLQAGAVAIPPAI